MNTHSLLPIAAALFIACAGSAIISSQSQGNGIGAEATSATSATAATTATTAIIDLPTVTVRPDAEDLAYYQANRIVDLEVVTVRPHADDLQSTWVADATGIVDLPTLTVRADADDARLALSGLVASAGMLAAR